MKPELPIQYGCPCITRIKPHFVPLNWSYNSHEQTCRRVVTGTPPRRALWPAGTGCSCQEQQWRRPSCVHLRLQVLHSEQMSETSRLGGEEGGGVNSSGGEKRPNYPDENRPGALYWKETSPKCRVWSGNSSQKKNI